MLRKGRRAPVAAELNGVQEGRGARQAELAAAKAEVTPAGTGHVRDSSEAHTEALIAATLEHAREQDSVEARYMVRQAATYGEMADRTAAELAEARDEWAARGAGRTQGLSAVVRWGRVTGSAVGPNRAACPEASLSGQPANCIGWFARMPTLRPSTRPKPTMIFIARSACTSRNSSSSRMRRITSCMS